MKASDCSLALREVSEEPVVAINSGAVFHYCLQTGADTIISDSYTLMWRDVKRGRNGAECPSVLATDNRSTWEGRGWCCKHGLISYITSFASKYASHNFTPYAESHNLLFHSMTRWYQHHQSAAFPQKASYYFRSFGLFISIGRITSWLVSTHGHIIGDNHLHSRVADRALWQEKGWAAVFISLKLE